MPTGFVKKITPSKGFCFLKPDDPLLPEIFAHISDFREFAMAREKVTRVSYKSGQGRDGRKRALEVKIITEERK